MLNRCTEGDIWKSNCAS